MKRGNPARELAKQQARERLKATKRRWELGQYLSEEAAQEAAAKQAKLLLAASSAAASAERALQLAEEEGLTLQPAAGDSKTGYLGVAEQSSGRFAANTPVDPSTGGRAGRHPAADLDPQLLERFGIEQVITPAAVE